MKKIFTSSIIIILLFSLSGYASAQCATIYKNDAFITENDQHQKIFDSYLKIKSKTEQETMAKAIDDYVAGRTNKLPQYIDYNDSPYQMLSQIDLNIYPVKDIPAPKKANTGVQQNISSLRCSIPPNIGYASDKSCVYVILNDPTQNRFAASIEGKTSSISYLQDVAGRTPDCIEQFVYHLWGTRVDGSDAENNIQILRCGDLAVLNFYDGNYHDGVMDLIRDQKKWPVGDTFSVYVKAWTFGGRNYNYIEYGVFDLTTGVGYQQIYQLPVTQIISHADVALEKKYDYNELRTESGTWKCASDVIVYTGDAQLIDIYNDYHIAEWRTSDVNNAYHIHTYTYRGVPNTMGYIYEARFNTVRPIDP